MIDPLFTGSLVASSLVLPFVAARVPQVRWSYKVPACLLLANIIPFPVVRIFKPDFEYGALIGVAVLMHLIISLLLVVPVSAIIKAQGGR